MNEKNYARIMELAKPVLRDGEHVEMVCTSNVGKVSVKRQVATAAVVAIASLGTVMAAVRPKTRYVVLTEQRLLFFDMAPSGRPAGPVLADLPRQALASERFKSALKATFYIRVDGSADSLKMEFPFPARGDARKLADALAR